MENARREVGEVAYADDLNAAVQDADLVCVLTAWEEFRYADPSVVGTLVNGKRVIDGLNCLDQVQWTAAGWEYRGMGRPS
jgi:UDPglucose 6-dehydrogenase